MGEKHITIYSFSTCQRCKIIKQMLNAHHIQYEEIIDNKPLMLEREIENVPAIEVDGKIIDDYSFVLMWLQDNQCPSE